MNRVMSVHRTIQYLSLFVLFLFFSLPRFGCSSGFADVVDEEEKEHPWESEDLEQHHKDQRLFDAVVDGNNELVKIALKIGAHFHHHKNGYTPLMMAAWLDHEEICRTLIKVAHAHLEQKDKFGRTAFMIAALRGSLGCGKVLYEAGADLDASARNKPDHDVVSHAHEAANHPDATQSTKDLHRFLSDVKAARDDNKKQEKELKKAAAKAERQAARLAKAAEL